MSTGVEEALAARIRAVDAATDSMIHNGLTEHDMRMVTTIMGLNSLWMFKDMGETNSAISTRSFAWFSRNLATPHRVDGLTEYVVGLILGTESVISRLARLVAARDDRTVLCYDNSGHMLIHARDDQSCDLAVVTDWRDYPSAWWMYVVFQVRLIVPGVQLKWFEYNYE